VPVGACDAGKRCDRLAAARELPRDLRVEHEIGAIAVLPDAARQFGGLRLVGHPPPSRSVDLDGAGLVHRG
jgi:hypothetical protein